jgi:6-phosphofructokinase 1
MERIGVLTSGGDAPGMNACIRAIVRAGLAEGLEIFGIRRGFAGLIEGDIEPLDRRSVANVIHVGGTILGTSRSEEFRSRSGREAAMAQIKNHRIEGLVLIGGDGTFRGGVELAQEASNELAVMGIPGTIDNDVYGTDVTIGFDTAVATGLDAIDKIRDTAQSHERLFLVEVMGRDTGFIALETAIAGGAEELITPELESTPEQICDRLRASFDAGKQSAIVVVAEGRQPGRSVALAEEIRSRLGVESRVAVLGHIQRGGTPTHDDRILASALGVAAVEALLGGKGGSMVGMDGTRTVTVPLEDTFGRRRSIEDIEMIWLFRLLSS